MASKNASKDEVYNRSNDKEHRPKPDPAPKAASSGDNIEDDDEELDPNNIIPDDPLFKRIWIGGNWKYARVDSLVTR